MNRGALAVPEGKPSSCSVTRSKSRKGAKRSTGLTSLQHRPPPWRATHRAVHLLALSPGECQVLFSTFSSSVAVADHLLAERVEVGEILVGEREFHGVDVLFQPLHPL